MKHRNKRTERAEINQDLAATVLDTLESLKTEISRLANEVEKLWDQHNSAEDRLDQQDARLSSLDGRLTAVESLMDSVRDEAAKSAIGSGTVTSVAHLQHAEISNSYRSLIRHDLRSITALLCPQRTEHNEFSADELMMLRARAAADVVRLSFGPVIREGPLDQLAGKGYMTDSGDFRDQLAKFLEKANDLRARMAETDLPATLNFAVEVGTLKPDDYQIWNPQHGDGGRPAFLIAPAYVVGGARPQQLTPPVVFVPPVAGS